MKARTELAIATVLGIGFIFPGFITGLIVDYLETHRWAMTAFFYVLLAAWCGAVVGYFVAALMYAARGFDNHEDNNQ